MKVILICVSAICGRISPATCLGGSEDRRLLEEMRDQTDAGLIGAGTLRAENPEMRGIGGVLSPKRIRAIISGRGVVADQDKNIFKHGPPPLVFTAVQHVGHLQKQLDVKAEVIGLDEEAGVLSLSAMKDHLAARGVGSLLIEGGGKLNYAALQQGIIDEIYLTIAPKLSGDHHAASLVYGPNPLGDPYLNLEMLSCRTSESGEIFLRYKVNKAEEEI